MRWNDLRLLPVMLPIVIAFCAMAATDADPSTMGRASLERNEVDATIANFEKAVAANPNNREQQGKAR